VLFVYRPSTTWPGLLIMLLGIPIYLLIRWCTPAQSAPAGRPESAGL